jgi:methionine-rich copper-binding protein CopC/putative copper export protein
VKTRRVLLGAAVALGALMGTGPAAAVAHPLLIQSTPQPGVVAAASPAGIGLAFTEPTVPRGSSIRLYGPKGAKLPVTAVQAADGRRTLTVKPRTKLRSAVYQVRWSALGDDGHIVTGSFDFGVAGPKGAAPPGVETLSGSGGGRGAENASGDSFARVLGRWLGILSASLLFGGFLLVALLRRRGFAITVAPRDADEDDEDADVDPPNVLQRVAPLAWVLIAFAAVEGVLSGASSGTGDKLDFGLLTASATGVSELIRAVLVALGSVVLALTVQRRRHRDTLYLLGGVAVLLTYALSGHVLSVPTFWALLDQGVHVVAAGLWLGGVLALVLLTTRGEVRLLDGARAFAPVAGAALGVAIVTGALAAIREVDRWYFLRWSDYGRIVIIKAVLVGLVTLAGAAAWWRSRGADAPGPRPRLLRVEALGVVGVLVLATTLSGLAQGRGQPLPAERGTLFPGPAFATALLPKGNAQVALAPARSGANVVTVGFAPGASTPKDVRVRLVHGADTAQVRAQLRPHGGLTWSAPVDLGEDGSWFLYITVDGRTAPPVPVTVGLPHADGAPPVQVLAVADLSGPYAERCRAHIIGLELAIARINAAGGLDDGHKVAPLVLDSGGTAAGAAAAARRGLKAGPIASAGACGTGAVAAVDAASRAGIPSIVGDPGVDPTNAPNVFRLAADPFAQGVAFGQLIRNRILAAGVPGVRTVRADLSDDLQSRRLLAGLRVGLRASSAVRGAPVTGPEPKLVLIRAGSLAKLSDDALQRLITHTRTSAFILDGPDAGGADAQAIARIGDERGQQIAPSPLLLSERVLSETLVQEAGTLGRIGAIQGVSEVATNTPDAELYQGAVPLLFRGNLASVDGLRGYATGLALRDAVRSGTGRSSIEGHLRAPRVFTTALLAPWSPRLPGAGSPFVVALQPSFLSPTLVPAQAGGESQDSTYFPQGSWTVTSGTPLGVIAGLRQPPVG